ncbi:LiaF transmembrane domain-containing protein [Lachnoclostridium phytofermentans]|uniref:Uncharacterized protein n=1 Tax=Lachnoclostridium phytofermentans (strain ATCC 700394 / DSM 18823 / ISDg) TaxID=357809 RepID=A9KHE2_LACP7|nr:LiaF domain-containing protein [Lachnoclostridium phytofermentans]ABX40809.1 hypothetical protein Cphy_0422 [Lachnoclostridium phytofermentans ISDg]
MKKNHSSYIWGGLLVLFGVLLAARAVDIFTFDIFFDGWWTLFLIIPCFISLFNHGGDKTANLIGLSIGIFMLLSAQGFITWRMFGPLCFAAILVFIGLNMIMPKKHRDQDYSSQNYKTYQGSGSTDQTYDRTYTYEQNFDGTENGQQSGNYGSTQNTGGSNDANSGYQNTYQGARQSGQFACTAVLSGRELRFDNEVFQGAMLSALLGGIELDLRNAIIRENVVIECKTILGGIDIYVPSYVRVVVNCNPILGGVDNKTITPLGANEQTITIYLNATCVLGGIDVK